jgi:hypothetical protein
MERGVGSTMKYHTTNEFEHFEFQEVHISDVQAANGFFHLVLDDVIILPENSCNRDIRKMRANGLVLKIADSRIESLIEEGYKTYDADGKLQGETSDRTVDDTEYSDIFAAFPEGYVYSAEKKDSTYIFVVDAVNEHTYELRVSGSGDVQEWDKFLNIE